MRYSKPARTAIAIITLLWSFSLNSPVEAITVSLDPADQNVSLGNQAIIDIRIHDFLSSSAPLVVQRFNVFVNYDPSILSFNAIAWGTALGNPDPLSGETSLVVNPGSFPGGDTWVQLYAQSFLPYSSLYTLQSSNDFLAARVTFDTLAGGTSPVDVMFNIPHTKSMNSEGEIDGFAQNHFAGYGSVIVNGVPEPMSILLLGFGLIGLAGIRRRMR